jgi:flagellar protein FliO/FliZ
MGLFILLSMDGPSGGGMLSFIGSFFYILVVLGFIIGLCYFVLRMMGRVKGRGGTAGNLHLMESILVGSQNMVQLVRAGDKYLVIGVTKERITLLAELTEAQIKEIEPLPPIRTSFNKILERFMPPKDEESDQNQETK